MIVESGGLRVDLDGATWQRSTPPGRTDGSCVEVAFIGDVIAVRDGSDPQGPALVYTREEWAAFIAGVKDGEFDR